MTQTKDYYQVRQEGDQYVLLVWSHLMRCYEEKVRTEEKEVVLQEIVRLEALIPA